MLYFRTAVNIYCVASYVFMAIFLGFTLYHASKDDYFREALGLNTLTGKIKFFAIWVCSPITFVGGLWQLVEMWKDSRSQKK